LFVAQALLSLKSTAVWNTAGEAAMRNHRRLALFAAALIPIVTFAVPTVEAGGAFGIHIGSGGFGVSVGFGDWGVYTSSWSDPYWSIDFNATLAGYGQWTWVGGLGRVWRPWVATSWRPYTYGRWVYTSYGWTWVAYEPWGYVPHHYGSWAYTSFGWVWVPGYSYSCANVVWVRAGGYVGWYARPPWGWSHAHHGFHHGYNHGYRDGFGNGYHSGYHDGWRDARYATYVDWKHFGSDNVARRSVSHRIVSMDRIEGLSNGPTRDEVRRRGGSAVSQTPVSRRTVTMDGREITIARPEGVAQSIERNAAETAGSALSRQALDQRQPLVTPRSLRTAEARSSKPAISSRETRSVEVQRPTRRSSPQARQPARSTRSSFEGKQIGSKPNSRTPVRVTDSGSSARRAGVEAMQLRPRRTEEIGLVGDRGSRSAPSASQPSRSSSERQRIVQPSLQMSTPQRSSVGTRAPQSDSRRSAAAQQRASTSPKSPARSEKSASARSQRESSKKRNEESSRRRRR
jgi:hypothetical protein